jgi:hypothetical protein
MLLPVVMFCAGCPGPDNGPDVHRMLLPQSIQVSGQTGWRQFGEAGDVEGIEAQIEAIDHFGERTRAFGTFQFELYLHRDHQADPRGKRIAFWAVDVTTTECNLEYWDRLFRAYRFPLRWDKPIAAGRKLVLHVRFSPQGGGDRLFANRVLVSGG